MLVLRYAQRAIYTRGDPKPQTSTMTLIPLTPPQMQRECNVVAFGELILSTRLKHKHENDTSKVRNQRCHQSVQLLNLSMQKMLLHKRVLPSQPYFSKWPESSQTSTSTPQTRALLWRLELEKNSEMCQTSQRQKSPLQDGKWRDRKVMTTNKRPLIITWSKTAPKGTKRALPHQQR